MLYNYKMEDTFSDYPRFPKTMSVMRYNNIDERDKFADYKIKDDFKINSRIETIHDNKFLDDKFTNYKIYYKIYRKQCKR